MMKRERERERCMHSGVLISSHEWFRMGNDGTMISLIPGYTAGSHKKRKTKWKEMVESINTGK